jgi:hypothetical protein
VCISEVVHGRGWLGKGAIGEEAVVKVRLVRYGGRHAMHGGWCDEVGPIAVVVDAVLGVCSGGEGMRVGEMERVRVGEEVGDGLALDVGQQRVACIVFSVEVAAREGVCSQGQSRHRQQRRAQRRGHIQPNGDGSLSPMPVRGVALAVAPAGNKRAASLTAKVVVVGKYQRADDALGLPGSVEAA